MAKFERNPSRSFPEKTKNKLPDFPLLIYRLYTLHTESDDYLLCLLSLELGGLSRQRGLTIIVHYISDNNDIIPCPPPPRSLTYWHRKSDGVKHIIISLENVFYYFNSLRDILYVF